MLEKFATIPMLDVYLPTTDQRTVELSRYPQPETDGQRLMQRLKLELPVQLPPKITGQKLPGNTGSVVKTRKIRALICSHLHNPPYSNPPSCARLQDGSFRENPMPILRTGVRNGGGHERGPSDSRRTARYAVIRLTDFRQP